MKVTNIKVIMLGDHAVAESIIQHYNVLKRDVFHHKRLTFEVIDINDFDEICLLSGNDDVNKAIVLLDDIAAAYDMSSNHGKRLLFHLLVQQSKTLHMLQTCDLCDAVRKKLDIYPFSMEEIWCRSIQIDYEPITIHSEKHVHLVIFGMGEVAKTMAIQAAHIAHYPNYVRNHSLRTRITMIAPQAESLSNAAVLHQELAQLNYKLEEYKEAYEHIEKVCDYYKNRMDLGVKSDVPMYYKTLSLLALCNAQVASMEEDDDKSKELFEQSLNHIETSIGDVIKHKDKTYYDRVRIKGKILMMMFDRLHIDRKKDAANCYTQYVNYQRETVDKRLSQMTESQKEQNWLALHQFLFDCYRLGDESPEMLYDLALFSKEYLLQNQKDKDIRWKQIRSILDKQECAIEFVQYQGSFNQMMLGCLVLKKDSKRSLFIEISKTDSILKRNVGENECLTVGKAMTYQPSDPDEFSVKDELYSDSALFHKIWTPELMEAIGDAKKVYFSPDGFLHQLAIEYMMPDSTKDCYRLSSTRVLLRKNEKPNIDRMILLGNIDYYAEIDPKTNGNDVVCYDYLAGHGRIGELPFAQMEVDSIVASRIGYRDTVLVGSNATDENLKDLLQNHYSIVHILTHGFYIGSMKKGTDLKPTTSDKTMSKNGLTFAGLVTTLTNRKFDKNLFDGILSAAEFSKLDMNGVELATLSSCQTGLGEITSDGVYGMQRGLKQAGVKSMMISLWSVTNYSSSLFYKHFYQALSQQENKSFHDAFKKAREKLAKEEYVRKYLNLITLDEGEELIPQGLPQHTHQYILIDAF